MPTRRAELDLAGAAARIAERSLRPGAGDRVGIEVEMLPVDGQGRRADHRLVAEAVEGMGPLASGTTVTFEPGGQLELSTPPAAGLDDACAMLSSELAAVDDALAGSDVRLVGLGLAPQPEAVRRRVFTAPRYDAMAAYFAGQGPFGATMMCATAGLQINLDCEPAGDRPGCRFELAQLLGPTLAASFANSPLTAGRPTGWKSGRLANWWRLDPSRTAPVPCPGRGTAAWADYALAAGVMAIRTAGGAHVVPARPMRLRDWVTDGHELGFPTADDVDNHLTTLFPPVRPRGWLELRMVDSLPAPWWPVPVAVATALLHDAEAAEAAARAAGPTAGLWVEASRAALDHPGLAAAARACFAAAGKALGRLGASTTVADAVAAYADRYVARDRTPADDVLDRFHAAGGEWRPAEWMCAGRFSAV